VTIRSVEADELETTLVARAAWKLLEDGRHAALLQLVAPEEVARMGVLVREAEAGALAEQGPRGSEIYLYLPEFRRVRRVSPRQATTSLFGTAFSYEDFDRLHGQIRSSRIETLGEVQCAGRRAYLVEAKPNEGEESTYTQVRSLIDAETCLPLRVEYFDASGELSKRLETDPATFERVKGIWIARSVAMSDLEEGVESVLSIDSIRFDEDIPDRTFTPASLADDY
jgi:outer membrane lipoprotein-sorting protein